MLRKPSKSDRVAILIIVMATFAIVVGGAVSFVMTKDAATLESARANAFDVLGSVNELNVTVAAEKTTLDNYVLSHDSAELTKYRRAIDHEVVVVGALKANAAGLTGVTASLGTLESINLAWQTDIAAPAIDAELPNDQTLPREYARQSGRDHEAVDAASAALSGAIDRVSSRLSVQQSTNEVGRPLAIAFVFGALILAFGIAVLAVHRFGRALEREARQATVLNKFTEVAAFAADDHGVAVPNLVALGRLAGPDASVMHILNQSMDRAVPEASTGDAIAVLLPLRALDRCSGVLRGTMYVSDDLSDAMNVHCPIYPAAVGTLACIPLDSGETVGAVHLYWERPNALPLSLRANIARITEHAALSIGNRRLFTALHGQANTDPRTGLANGRAFDVAVETAFAARGVDECLSILMLDIDHFKDFNDRYGHPAGDEALRTFAGVLRSCMRDADIAARYGGEEFAVLLTGVGVDGAMAIAERIRARTESTIVSISPGISDHLTVSIGVATAPDQAVDRLTLLRLSDEALYRAKEGGRNRILGASGPQAISKPTVLAELPVPIAS